MSTQFDHTLFATGELRYQTGLMSRFESLTTNKSSILDYFIQLTTTITALSAAMRYILKPHSYAGEGEEEKLYYIIAGSAVLYLQDYKS
ncbi:hypothetical protein [Nostoc sp. CALU 546]|uniref:hypothetical protein n=1 Tax=Nostoc sp. CALU 546 TaxID=1867241 RepID=UPI003B66E9A4